MTTEVVVINRDAVALAADSAATSVSGIHKFANKLFGLVYDWPIALMVYNSSSFMGMPWEVLIHGYRERVTGQPQFRTLNDCVEDFLTYLEEVGKTPPVRDLQPHYFQTLAIRFFKGVFNDFDRSVQMGFRLRDNLSDQDLKTLLDNAIAEASAEINALPNAEGLPLTHPQRILVEAREELERALTSVFERMPLDETQQETLLQAAAQIFIKDLTGHPLREYTGIVLAGFGKDDIFPCCRAFKVEGMVFDSLRYRENPHQSYMFTPDKGPTVIPYAQADVILSFLFGVHERFSEELYDELDQLFEKDFASTVDDLTDAQLEQIDDWRSDASDKLRQKLQLFQRNIYIDPFMKSIRFAHRKELGELARSLVEITALRRRFSGEIQSVGGEIDVAVVSKKDGLIWLHRKQYFDNELNPHFFTRYEK